MSPSQTFALLLERHYPALHRYALRRTGSRSMADDVMQDVWLRLASKGDPTSPDTIDSPEAYLHRIIDNLVIDRQRQAAARTRHLVEGMVPEDVPSEAPGPYQDTLGRQEFALLCQAVDSLPARCRQVFLLYRGQGLSMAEVAVRLGISVKTVENHLTHAMVHCRRQMRQGGREA